MPIRNDKGTSSPEVSAQRWSRLLPITAAYSERAVANPITFLVATSLLSLAIALAVYGPFIGHWLATDDFLWIGAATQSDFAAFVRGAFELPHGPTPYWRPAIDFYFFGMYRIFHLNATAYHAANVLLHALSAGLIALITWRVSKVQIAGVLAAVIFAASPSFGDTVTWASAITEVLANVAGLLSIAAFLHYRRAGSHEAWFLSVAAFVLALLSHELSVMLPLILLVIAVAEKPPTTPSQARALAIAIAPMFAIDLGYVAMQASQVLASSSGAENYAFTLSGLPRLLDRMLWMSMPVQTTGEVWVEPARWAVLCVSVAAVAVGARNRNWALPALFAATIFALFPTVFLTKQFAPRWVYLAAAPWSAFVAVLIVSATDLLRPRRPVLSYIGVVVVLVLGGSLFVPEAVDAQHFLSTQASQMESVRQELQSHCPTLGAGRRVLLFPLPVVDPGYIVPSLVSLLFPGAVSERAVPAMRPPSRDDCVLDYAQGKYRATKGDRVDASEYWAFSQPVACPEALDWRQAARHQGERNTVSGPFVGARTTIRGDQALLDIGRRGAVVVRYSGQDALDAFVIFGQLRGGTNLCVTGFVHSSRGLVVIDVDSPRSIVVRKD